MATTRYTVVSPDEVLAKENVTNAIQNIAPTMTPFLSSLKKRATIRTEFETPQDTLRDPANNVVIQGDKAVTDKRIYATKVKGHTQLMDEVIEISDTAEAESHYGYGSEMAYHVGKAGLELKRDMEHRLCNNYSAKIISGDSQKANSADLTAGETGSMSAWVNTNLINKFATSSTEERALVKGGYDTTAGRAKGYVIAAKGKSTWTAPVASSYKAWTEQDIRDAIVSVAEQSDMVKVPMIMLSLKNREKFSRIFNNTTTGSQITREVSEKRGGITVRGSVKYYESDFGVHRVMFNRFMNPSWIALPDPRYWRLRYLQPYKVVPLAREGHSRRRMLRVEFGLESMQEKASALLIGVTSGDTAFASDAIPDKNNGG